MMTPALEARLDGVAARHEELCALLTANPPPPPEEMVRVNKELARAEKVAGLLWFTRHTFSLNLRLGQGKCALFIGFERLKTDELRCRRE